MSVGVGSPSVLILRLYKHCQETNTGSYRLCQCVYLAFTARKKPYYVYYFFSFFKKIFIYLYILTVLGLGCSTWNLHSWHVNS